MRRLEPRTSAPGRRLETLRALSQAGVPCGVLVAPGDCFGMPAHFRLGFAATGDRFPLGLERLYQFLRTDARERSSVPIA